MAKVILICGKLCSGKTYYAKKLCEEKQAVLLSSDELVSALFHPDENDYHDKIIKNVHGYLMQKSLEILKAGTNVILDWGFWTNDDREYATHYYRECDIEVEWHYLNVDKCKWEENIRSRNEAVMRGDTTDYYVDEGLLNKLESLFEEPDKNQIDVWV